MARCLELILNTTTITEAKARGGVEPYIAAQTTSMACRDS